MSETGRTLAEMSDPEIFWCVEGDVVVEHLRGFTLRTLHELTPNLDGADRALVFAALPVALQTEAWAELDARVDARSRELFADSRC